MSNEEDTTAHPQVQNKLHTSTSTENSSYEERHKRKRKHRPKTFKAKAKDFCLSLLIHYYNTNYFMSLSFGIALLLLSLLTWNYMLVMSFKNDRIKIMKCGKLLLAITSFIVPYILISLLIRWITSYTMQKKKTFSYILYVVNTLASNISFSIVTAIILGFSVIYNYQFKIVNQLDLNINTHDVLTILLFGSFILCLISAFVCNIAFHFNRDTLIDRMLVVFKVDYFIKLLKFVKAHKTRSTQIPKSDWWEYAFPWITSHDDHHKYQSKSYGSKKELFFMTNIRAITPSLRDWVYMEFRRQPIDIIYASKSGQMIDLENKKLPKNLRKLLDPDSTDIYSPFDIKKFFSDTKKYEMFCKAMNFNENTPFTHDYMKSLFKRNFAEKRYIQLSLDQINGALIRIKHSVFAIIIILIVIYTSIIAYGNHQIILAVVSTFFGTGYAFKSSVKNAVDNIVFLLCIHPFDVGDRVLISLDSVCQNLVVQEMNVFSTIFTKFDGTQTYVPNIALATKQIVNISRSGYMLETHKLKMNTDIKENLIESLDMDIRNYLNENAGDYTGFFMINIEEIENMNKMRLSILLQYKRNWHDYYGYLTLKDRFLSFLRERLMAYEVDYVLPRQKIEIIK